MGSLPRSRTTRDEAVKAANLADGYDSTDSEDDDGLGGMRGYRGRGAMGASRKPMRPPASADAFRAVPRDPQVQDDKSGQIPTGITPSASGDSIEPQSKVAALEARLAAKPTQVTTAWGQSPDPRR